MTVARLAGRVAGVPRARGCPSWSQGRLGWSGGLRERVDALPRGGDRVGPWPAGLDFQAAAPPAAGQAGRGVQHPVRSVFGSALARSPSRASSLSQASRICPVIEAVSHAPLTW